MYEEAVDRVAPTLRPHQRAVAFQRWRDILFLHWRYDPDVVRQIVPRDLQLDLYGGAAWVTCVARVVKDSRPALVPPGSGLDYLECELRTCVVGDGRPGTWTFSLDCSSRMATRVGRVLAGAPSMDARIESTHEGSGVDVSVERLSMGRPKLRLHYEVGETAAPVHADSQEWFLLERYHRFTRRLGRMLREQVHHAPYRPQDAYVVIREEELLASAGLPRPDVAPLAHWQAGLDVELFAPIRARTTAQKQPAPA